MLDFTEIKNRATFFECEEGRCEEYIAYGDAYRDEDTLWHLYGYEVKTGRIIHFMYNPEFPQYAPRLYKERQYV